MSNIFGMVKDMLIEMMHKRPRSLWAELVVGQFGALTIAFRNLCLWRSRVLREEGTHYQNPLDYRSTCAFRHSFFPKELNTRFASSRMRDGTRNL